MRRVMILLLVTAGCRTSSKARKNLGTLTNEEVKQLCERVDAYRFETATLPGADKVRCGTDALAAAGAPDNSTAAAMESACRKALAACAAAPAKPTHVDCAWPSASLVPGFREQIASCADATVDELFACTEEMRSMMVGAARLDPCAVAFNPADPLASYNHYLQQMKGPRCAAFQAKCKPH